MSIWRQCLGKLAKGLSEREVAVDLGLDYDMPQHDSLEGTQIVGYDLRCI
jgi:hypothetical protein